MTIKISDISVGDWVMVNGKPRKISVLAEVWNGSNEVLVGYVAHVNSNGYNVVFYKPIEHVKPIPITAEILEKNGLYRHEIDKDNPQQVVLSNHFMMARTYDDVEWWRVLIYDEEILSKELFNGIVYSVHQLQHAFRLTEIDKEINL